MLWDASVPDLLCLSYVGFIQYRVAWLWNPEREVTSLLEESWKFLEAVLSSTCPTEILNLRKMHTAFFQAVHVIKFAICMSAFMSKEKRVTGGAVNSWYSFTHLVLA